MAAVQFQQYCWEDLGLGRPSEDSLGAEGSWVGNGRLL